MARIIENIDGKRRIIKLSSEDIISVVREYQRIITSRTSYRELCDILHDNVIFIPEDC